MKKILSLFCCVALLLSLLSGDALAVQTYTTSEAGLAMIKDFEGYRQYPYADSRGEWYIGYGTKCDPELFSAGVTEAEATAILRNALLSKEDAVNKLLQRYALEVTQQQFDAMVSMTYTLGTQWINPTYRFCAYLINGVENYTEVEVVNAIGTWCHQGSSVVDGLAVRRLREAFLFLYGDYGNRAEDYYTYLHFDAAGGSVENRTVFYPIGLPYGELPVAEMSGRRFLGWTTEDGETLTGEEIALEKMTVTARWVGDETVQQEYDYSSWVNPYSDVKEDDWYYGYVRELSVKGVVGGYDDGTFQQAGKLKTGEALKLILRAAGYGEQAPVDAHWASGYMVLALQLGCFESGEIVELDAPISREKIAEITTKALGLAPRSGTSPFADADNGYLLTMYEEGIFGGTVIGGQRFFYPADSISRAEVCAVISRVSSWVYTEKEDPGKTGFVTYRDKTYPVFRNVPVCSYDKNLFVLDESTKIMYYNDGAYQTALGIDVSSHQKEIDWNQVAASGVEFVMIRLGFRGYGEEGTLNLDPYFHKNLAGAKAAGLKVGAYFFSQAINVDEALEEAMFVLENLGGATLDYPMVYDWEPITTAKARTDGLDMDTLTDCAIAFCDAVSYAGYIPMIYYNLPVGYTRYDLSRLTSYDVWFAQYAAKPTMYYDYRIWQYTDSGRIPGIETTVDMNIAFIPY